VLLEIDPEDWAPALRTWFAEAVVDEVDVAIALAA
jgi:hypothetical protein